MTPFRHILVPTDFSEPAAHALEYGIDLCHRLGTQLTVLHVCEAPITVYPLATFWSADVMKLLEDAAQKKLDEVMASVRKLQPEAHGLIVSGFIDDVIRETITQVGADLVVLGSHGHRGLKRAMVGSTTEKIVRLSSVPVLVVHAAAGAE